MRGATIPVVAVMRRAVVLALGCAGLACDVARAVLTRRSVALREALRKAAVAKAVEVRRG